MVSKKNKKKIVLSKKRMEKFIAAERVRLYVLDIENERTRYQMMLVAWEMSGQNVETTARLSEEAKRIVEAVNDGTVIFPTTVEALAGTVLP